jgi:hypothetical protein
LRNALNLFIFVCFQIFFCYQGNAQCSIAYGTINDSILFVKANTKASENLFFRDHYEDILLGDIYVDISTGLFIYFYKTLDFIKKMDFLVVVYVSNSNINRHFRASRIDIEFDDHTGFVLKSDTLLLSSSIFTQYFAFKAFYLDRKSFVYLMNKPVFKVTVIDDYSDKQIVLEPDKDEFMKQTGCLSNYIPKETTVERYSHVMDSLLHTNKYGSIGK